MQIGEWVNLKVVIIGGYSHKEIAWVNGRGQSVIMKGMKKNKYLEL